MAELSLVGLKSVLQRIKGIYGGAYGVISQTQTWASDRSGYTMSNQKWGHIPQANIDLFLSAGAEFNNTKQPITKVAPWGEEVQHLPGYFYLNGLGDISYEEIQVCWVNGKANSPQDTGLSPRGSCRTTFPSPLSASFYNNYYRPVELRIQVYTSVISIESWSRFNGQTITVKALQSVFYYGERLMYVCDILNIDSGNPGSAHSIATPRLYALRVLRIKSLADSIDLSGSAHLYNSSILYMVQNATNGTTDITITLHADAYARAIADTDIQAAIEANGHITLASA